MKTLIYVMTLAILIFAATAIGRFQIADAQVSKIADEQTRPEGTIACAPPPSGIVAWYRSEDNGLDVFNLNDATLLNGASYSAGKVGRAFTFDGVNDYAYVPNTASQNFGTGDFSVEYWVKIDDLTTNTNGFLTKDDYTGGVNHKGWLFNIADSIGGIGFQVRNTPAGSDNSARWATSNFSTGTWYHFAGIRRSGVIEFYVNGVLRGSATEAIPTDVSNNYEMRIGALSDGDTQNFAGQIDEPTLYNRALTLSEIQSIYNANSGGKCLYCTPAPVGLVSLYEGENNALDSRSRNDGSLQNGATFSTGKVGQGFDLDGVNDYISIPDSPSVRPASALTVGGWFKFDSVIDGGNGGANHLVAKPWGTSFGDSFAIALLPNGHLYPCVGQDASGCIGQDSGFTITTGNWYHIMMTYDDAANMVRLFVDGANVYSFATSVTIAYDSHPLVIGADITNETPTYFNDGQADEVSLYDRALTPIEIRNMFQAGGNGMCRPTATTAPSGVAGWWGGDGDALDISGNGNNGSMQNGALFAVDKVGQGFKFDGVDDYVLTPDSATLRPTNLTIEGWFNWTSFGGPSTQQVLVSKTVGTGGLDSFALFYETNAQRLVGVTSTVGGYNEFLIMGFTPVLGTWYHITYTYDDGANVQAIYVNGSGTAGGVSNSIAYDAHPVTIGAGIESEALNQNFPGKADEVTIYNRALSQAEIQSIANAGLGGKLKPTANATNYLVSAWRAEGNANDALGTNNGNLLSDASIGSGVIGRGFSFDGIDDSVEIPDSNSLDITGEISINAWIYPTAATSGAILSKYDSPGTDASYSLTKLSSGQIQMNVQQGAFFSFIYRDANSKAAVPLNQWSHVVGTFNPATQAVKVYINGVDANAVLDPTSSTVTSINVTTTPVQIGALKNSFSGRIPFAGRIDEVAIYNRELTASEALALYKGVAPVSRQIGDVTLNANFTSIGNTQQIPLDPSLLPPLPMGATSLGLTYDVDTSAAYTGNVNLCFNVPSLTATPAPNLRVFHLENGAWVNRTAGGATHAALCTTGVTSLSPFAIASVPQTAADVSISGRVMTAEGRGIRNAVMTLTDLNGNPRNVIAGVNGYYRFDAVETGQTYILSIRSRRFQFDNPTRVISVVDNISGEDFMALPFGNKAFPQTVRAR